MTALAGTALQAEKRNEVVAGVVVAATVLVLGYASGLGHLLGLPGPTAIPSSTSIVPPTLPTDGTGAAGSRLSTEVPGAIATITSSSPAISRTRTAKAPVSSRFGASPAPASSTPSGGLPGTASSCDPGLTSSVADPLWTHVKKSHLEESPAQQIGDLLDLNRYVKTHTALLEAMVDPGVVASRHALEAAGVFWVHLKHGHLEESPGQQVSDVLSTDSYVTTHTVLVEDLIAPSLAAAAGDC